MGRMSFSKNADLYESLLPILQPPPELCYISSALLTALKIFSCNASREKTISKWFPIVFMTNAIRQALCESTKTSRSFP